MTALKPKAELARHGAELARHFCAVNSIPVPAIIEHTASEWRVRACAYYRPQVIRFCTSKCAAIGTAGRAWSYPGYVVDRTPFGVIQHELGHHVDWILGERKGRYWSEFGARLRAIAGEPPITSYCPNDAEWFAEMFRLFVTNPDLLRRLRPRTHALFLDYGLKPVFEDDWRARLDGAPERTITAAGNKIAREERFIRSAG